MQLLNRNFYNNIIPNSLHVLHIKKIDIYQPIMHLYIFNKGLWGIEITGRSDTRSIEFEEDEWIHENQYKFFENSNQLP